MESQSGKYDFLNFGGQKKVIKQLQNENLLLSCGVFKFNKRNRRQERNLVISQNYVCNFSSTSLKRKIEINKIKGVTISNLGGEFVIHVPDEYDYRYSQCIHRDKIIELIIARIEQTTGKGIDISFQDTVSLEKFTTTKNDKKKGQSKKPKDSLTYNLQEFQSRQSKVNDQILEMRKKTGTVYAKDKQEVSVDAFDCIKVLGRGAFGKVMLVEKKDTKEIYAMKSLRKEDIIEKEQVTNTKSEKMILEYISHPFLVKLAYCFQTPEKLFFVMDFMKGGELFQHLRNSRKFDENRALFYGSQIFCALQHLHQKEIIYRDLKPENILLDEQGNITLTDFGMAKKLENDITQTFCGTPEYLSPEVLLAQPYGKTSDWWSFGVLLYEMMIGIPPFYSQNQSKMFLMIKQKELMFPSQVKISDNAKDIITKLLHKNPSKRLGANGDQEIQQHQWFSKIDWKLLIEKKLNTPFKPKIQGDSWLGNFDQEFTSEEPVNSYAPVRDIGLLNKYNKEEFGDI